MIISTSPALCAPPVAAVSRADPVTAICLMDQADTNAVNTLCLPPDPRILARKSNTKQFTLHMQVPMTISYSSACQGDNEWIS